MGNMRTGTETVNSCIKYLVNSKVVNLNYSDYDDNGADSSFRNVFLVILIRSLFDKYHSQILKQKCLFNYLNRSFS